LTAEPIGKMVHRQINWSTDSKIEFLYCFSSAGVFLSVQGNYFPIFSVGIGNFPIGFIPTVSSSVGNHACKLVATTL
jgi:hypothetical protein